jgi:hypothetical protein
MNQFRFQSHLWIAKFLEKSKQFNIKLNCFLDIYVSNSICQHNFNILSSELLIKLPSGVNSLIKNKISINLNPVDI